MINTWLYKNRGNITILHIEYSKNNQLLCHIMRQVSKLEFLLSNWPIQAVACPTMVQFHNSSRKLLPASILQREFVSKQLGYWFACLTPSSIYSWSIQPLFLLHSKYEFEWVTLESMICRSVTKLNFVTYIYLFWETDYVQSFQIIDVTNFLNILLMIR